LDKEKDNVQNESCLKNIIMDTDKNQCATAESLYIDVDTLCKEHDLTGMKMWILENEIMVKIYLWQLINITTLLYFYIATNTAFHIWLE